MGHGQALETGPLREGSPASERFSKRLIHTAITAGTNATMIEPIIPPE